MPAKGERRPPGPCTRTRPVPCAGPGPGGPPGGHPAIKRPGAAEEGRGRARRIPPGRTSGLWSSPAGAHRDCCNSPGRGPAGQWRPDRPGCHRPPLPPDGCCNPARPRGCPAYRRRRHRCPAPPRPCGWRRDRRHRSGRSCTRREARRRAPSLCCCTRSARRRRRSVS